MIFNFNPPIFILYFTVRFDFQSEGLSTCCNKQAVLDTYGAFDIKIRNVNDNLIDEELYIPLPFNNAMRVVTEDTKKNYLVESNQDFWKKQV